MNEKDMQHGFDWSGQNVAGWDLSEKFDGCRVYWDGKVLWTRGGNSVSVPDSWCDELPATHLDGEMYDGVGGVYRVASALRTGIITPTMRLMVFDVPLASGVWSERMKGAPLTVHVMPVPFRTCASTQDAFAAAASVQARGGEGIVLRAPGLLFYRPGRTQQLLKFKLDGNQHYRASGCREG